MVKIIVEIFSLVLKPLFEALAPLIIKEMDDTCEEGSDQDKEKWQKKINSTWSEDAISKTNPKGSG